MMGAARTFGTSFDELSDGDGIAFSFGTHLQVKSESPAIIGNRIPLQFFPRSTTPHTHEARGIRGEIIAALWPREPREPRERGVRRAGPPQVSHVSHVSGGGGEPAGPGEPREPRERGGQASRPAQVSHVSHVSGGVRRAGRPQVSHVSHVSGGGRRAAQPR